MTDETRDKLLLTARDRLRNRPGAYRQFQNTIENAFEGQRMLTLASALPIVTRQAADFGIPGAVEAEAAHLLKIVDEWAKSQPQPPAVAPLPANDSPVKPKAESAEQRQARRYQMCINAGLTMPENDYGPMPRGIGELAKKEGIKRQSYVEDLKKHINRQ